MWRAASRYDADRGSAMAWVLTLAHRRAVDRVRSEVRSAERERRANEKRARFGIPKSERNKTAAEQALETRRLDGLRREDRASERDE